MLYLRAIFLQHNGSFEVLAFWHVEVAVFALILEGLFGSWVSVDFVMLVFEYEEHNTRNISLLKLSFLTDCISTTTSHTTHTTHNSQHINEKATTRHLQKHL